MVELAKWKRAQTAASVNGCQMASPFEYLDGIIRIVHRVGLHNEELKFILPGLKADTRASEPDWAFVIKNERNIQRMLQVSRGNQAETPVEGSGFVNYVQGNIGGTPGTSSSVGPTRPAVAANPGLPQGAASSGTYAQMRPTRPAAVADPGLPQVGTRQGAPAPKKKERSPEEMKEMRARIFCKFGINCTGSKDGSCQFNHDPNHPRWDTHHLHPNAVASNFPQPPEPRWSFEQCRANGICRQWMEHGNCLTEGCKYNHEIPIRPK